MVPAFSLGGTTEKGFGGSNSAGGRVKIANIAHLEVDFGSSFSLWFSNHHLLQDAERIGRLPFWFSPAEPRIASLERSPAGRAEVFNWTHRNQAQHLAEQDRKAREARKELGCSGEGGVGLRWGGREGGVVGMAVRGGVWRLVRKIPASLE